MADLVLTKDEAGKLRGLTDSDERRWSKFIGHVRDLPVGGTVKASFKLPRSQAFHRRHFAILGGLFASQEQFTDFEKFREWLQVGAGFCDIVPGPKGKPVAISRSIAWDALEEADFAEHHRAVMEFVRSAHYSRFLYPHLDDVQADQMVHAILQEFE